MAHGVGQLTLNCRWLRTILFVNFVGCLYSYCCFFFHLVLHRLVSFSFARQISKCMRYCTICCSSVPICHLLLTAELCLFFIPQERSLSYFFPFHGPLYVCHMFTSLSAMFALFNGIHILGPCGAFFRFM